MPKPLSQIAAEMRRREDERHDDDLDALREMENEDTDVMAGDNQPTEIPAAGDGVGGGTQRVWKKKGQKRTTRRVIMRPSRVKARDENTLVVPENEDDDEAEGEEEQLQDDGDRYPHGNEMQSIPDEIDDNDVFHEPDDLSEDDLAPSKSKRATQKTQTTSKQKQATGSDEKPLGKPPKPPKESNATRKKKDTFNPNATAHMNFRSLKIKNKNSKAKGRGGMGRGRFGRR
jgi:hypothetical protein